MPTPKGGSSHPLWSMVSSPKSSKSKGFFGGGGFFFFFVVLAFKLRTSHLQRRHFTTCHSSLVLFWVFFEIKSFKLSARAGLDP
jgi:hypothetical protein